MSEFKMTDPKSMTDHLQAPVDYIQRTRDLYSSLGHPAYQWVENTGSPPFHKLTKPLAQSKLAVIASGGIYCTGQIAFHYKDDISYRRVSINTPSQNLRVTHFAYDLTAARRDPNAVLPLEALRDLLDRGRIGALADNALTFMGGIYSSRKVRDILAPALVNELQQDEVDLAILIPV
jgi:D-proline reductase (dithiol) PrdB